MIESTQLGGTQLHVSRFGLGCGGPSRLGLKTHEDRAASVRLVRRAVELGITFFDTAESYGTESIVAEALGDLSPADRDRIVVCTKASAADWGKDGPTGMIAPADYAGRIDACLKNLSVDRIDIFMVHGLTMFEYDHAVDVILPVLDRAKQAGKVAHIGVSEHFNTDFEHEAFGRVLADDRWNGYRDVMMVAFSVLQQTAGESVLPVCQRKGLGTLGMFAVRRALTIPDRLGEVLRALVESGEVDAADVDLADPVGSVSPDGTAAGLVGAAYRFALAEPGMDVVLTGTGSIEHLESNVHALSAADSAVDADWATRMKRIFKRARSQSGQ